MYWKEGDASTGRLYFSVTPEGGTKTVIFDITNYTYHPSNTGVKNGLIEFNPFKLYTDPKFVNHIRDNGGVMQVFWDDVEFWSGKPDVDTQAPSIPTGLVASNIAGVGFSLSWIASTDNFVVAGYDVYQDGALKLLLT